MPQLSETEGVINAAVGSGGLHPRFGIEVIPVTTGFTWSLVQVMV